MTSGIDTETATATAALLRAFNAVFREGSISRAAARLGLSQPAITAHLRLWKASMKSCCSNGRGRECGRRPSRGGSMRRRMGST